MSSGHSPCAFQKSFMFVGKNLENSLDCWKELMGAVSGCHHVFDWIKDRIRIPFSNLPIDFEIENKHFSARENDFISKELKRLLKSDHVQLATDASCEGWGGIIVDSHQEAQGAWDRSTSSKSSNFREISAVLIL
ncbi:hypothetical protein RRG08_030992 [Elysia crispata]|uniref:Uncharacterized protein n=1 Tax=Elysia crispata TaxID=231223 RepID=A0AAE0ZTL3_9GAST|nr:hypothetical protein RRG08_030992 [Elysia crispata]